MLKIGIIGLGDIAQKAYLPIISRKNVQLHLYTRQAATLARVAHEYRLDKVYDNLAALIDSGIQAAFVHASTAAHEEVLTQLLRNNIHVHVDKPITADAPSSERLLALAEAENLMLTVGFNRRHAPAYRQLQTMNDPSMILMQKNRRALPAAVRDFIFDDFIHVVDTLLFLFPHPIARLLVSGRKHAGLLHHVTVQFVSAQGHVAIGIMNRDSGTSEERLEVFSASEKRVVQNLSSVLVQRGGVESRSAPGDWEATLRTRGFEPMIDDFLHRLAHEPGARDNRQFLLAHQLCERIVGELGE
ncbi:Gfo/Idh/MocA family oxidoreductase [Janthinobacterium sp.]|uniref:Gfo/Idh/MocA family protein n=1 Tax=Janthinobacterium sp. TaxID=1871054 RepID=UPI00293D8798|nr:Gfo/Idh/MocA family oxidoreductase [Janthinobacterium sp.]